LPASRESPDEEPIQRPAKFARTPRQEAQASTSASDDTRVSRSTATFRPAVPFDVPSLQRSSRSATHRTLRFRNAFIKYLRDGEYMVEVQLQDSAGKIVWKDGPSNHWVMLDPLEMYDFPMKMNVVFPASGIYQFVLVLNGDDVTRQRFHAKVAEYPDLEVNDEL
jgi:hypothetical protein